MSDFHYVLYLKTLSSILGCSTVRVCFVAKVSKALYNVITCSYQLEYVLYMFIYRM